MSESKRKYAHSIVGHSPIDGIRQNEDFYTTGDNAISSLEDVYTLPQKIWECACGNGRLSEQLIENGHQVYSTELFKRGYGKQGVDFLKQKKMPKSIDCIVTNPPYSQAVEFCLHALDLVSKKKGVVAMLLKLTFLESQNRFNNLFADKPMTYVFPFVSRLSCYKNDDRSKNNALMPFAWFVWDNSVKNDAPEIYWI